MQLNFNDEQMRAIVSKAIIDGLGDEQKQLLIAKAIEGMLGPANPNDYHDKRTKLEVAFDQAVSQMLAQIAREELERPEYQRKLRALFVEVAEKFFAGAGSGVATKLATALSTAFDKTPY